MPIGIPTACLYNLLPYCIKRSPTKKSAHQMHFDKTVYDIFGFLEVKIIWGKSYSSNNAYCLQFEFFCTYFNIYTAGLSHRFYCMV